MMLMPGSRLYPLMAAPFRLMTSTHPSLFVLVEGFLDFADGAGTRFGQDGFRHILHLFRDLRRRVPAPPQLDVHIPEAS